MFVLYLLSSAGLLAGLALSYRVAILVRRFTYQQVEPLPTKLSDLPTVSVCIPARNETHAMTQCLERVVASTYPKLEIIVLDDSSVDNTSIIIKSFAHAGVRFVEGSPLPEGWIGKTHAQQELYRESSGEYILFMDVDTYLQPHSIDSLVAKALDKKAAMVSVLPVRNDSWRASVLFATLRYFWAVLAHGQRYPAVASGAWMVERQLLKDSYDGFKQLRASAVPEREIARTAIDKQAYRFLMSTPVVGVSYEKKWRSQCDTSIRLLYPLLGGRPINALLGLALLGLLISPFAIVLSAVFTGWLAVHTVALAASLALLTSYVIFTSRVWRRGWLIGGLLLPIILIQEVILLVRSVYAYATGTVAWKGRPIKQSARYTAGSELAN